MKRRSERPRAIPGLLVLLLAAVAFAGCPKAEPELAADMPRVTSSSEVFKAAARQMVEPCNNPAEFGRCGCFLDGFRTSCDLVARCLEVGFCEVAQSREEGTDVTSESETFTAAARTWTRVCDNPAEFGRCGCRLDGLRTPCSLVERCLELGFCVVASEG